MDKDRGYAWVILGASTILMCIGPSTLTSAGFLFYEIPMKAAHQSWIIILFYTSWTFSALLAAFFAKQRPRQLSTTGAAIACIGFITSASSVHDPSWLYLTFSLSVGFGLGLSFHTAYLVVLSNFDHHKGLANGICQICIAIGQITTPLLLSIISMPRDRLQVKSLTTALGFLATLFFVIPAPPPQRQMSMIGERNRRYSGVSRRSSGSEGVPLHSGYVPSSNITINQGQPRTTRRRSQYLLQVSSSLLPNIPEEPESTHSTNDTLTSISSDSEIATIPQSFSSHSLTIMPTSGMESERISSSKVKGIGEPEKPIPLKQLSKESSPANQSKDAQSLEAKATKPTENPAQHRRYSESQLPSPTLPRPPIKSNSFPSMKSLNELTKEKLVPRKFKSKGESIIDFSLLQDVHFLNMAVFSGLCTVAIQTFPILLYFHIINLCEECSKEGRIALIIIYSVDLISRLLFSYLSDFALLSRRKMFLVGCLCGGILTIVTPLLHDFTIIYCVCVVIGMCFGIVMTSEYLMFMEEFGRNKFPLAYGYLNIFKLIGVIIIGTFVMNPLSVNLYPIHPFDVDHGARNLSLICDDLGVINVSENSTHIIRLLVSISVPPILCALAWITEDIYKASQKCSVQLENKNVTSGSVDTP